MGRNDDWAARSDEPPWEWIGRLLRRWWRRIAGPPPKLTEADIVPPGAWPICPKCVLPHHPLVARCPECGEIVTRWATSMAFIWIFVWGPKLQRVVSQQRISRLLCAGLLVSGIAMVVQTAPMLWWNQPPEAEAVWIAGFVNELVAGLANMAAGFRMIEVVVRKWGSWRKGEVGEPA